MNQLIISQSIMGYKLLIGQEVMKMIAEVENQKWIIVSPIHQRTGFNT
jgi:hypothetical protein